MGAGITSMITTPGLGEMLQGGVQGYMQGANLRRQREQDKREQQLLDYRMRPKEPEEPTELEKLNLEKARAQVEKLRRKEPTEYERLRVKKIRAQIENLRKGEKPTERDKVNLQIARARLAKALAPAKPGSTNPNHQPASPDQIQATVELVSSKPDVQDRLKRALGQPTVGQLAMFYSRERTQAAAEQRQVRGLGATAAQRKKNRKLRGIDLQIDDKEREKNELLATFNEFYMGDKSEEDRTKELKEVKKELFELRLKRDRIAEGEDVSPKPVSTAPSSLSPESKARWEEIQKKKQGQK